MSDDTAMICAFCGRSAADTCPRCQRPRCVQHGPGDPKARGWPAQGYQEGDICPACKSAQQRKSRKLARVVIDASAALVGMTVASVLVLLAGSALGLGVDILVLSMLLAELLAGSGSAYLADGTLQRYLERRDQRALTTLPEARLLPGEHD